ncbi:MAG: hypothetical protein MJA27_21100 [Pseudanabaenales cyanobacterium]|nr:hypothetical protein [Pseudanabaenales cyanobacterium]
MPPIEDTKIQIQKLAKLDYAKVLVICKLTEKSLSQAGQTALYTFLQRTWAQHEERLIFEAAQEGVSPEEKFIQLVENALITEAQQNLQKTD